MWQTASKAGRFAEAEVGAIAVESVGDMAGLGVDSRLEFRTGVGSIVGDNVGTGVGRTVAATVGTGVGVDVVVTVCEIGDVTVGVVVG